MRTKLLKTMFAMFTLLLCSVAANAQTEKQKEAERATREHMEGAATARDNGNAKEANDHADKAEKAAKEAGTQNAKDNAKDARQAANDALEKHGSK